MGQVFRCWTESGGNQLRLCSYLLTFDWFLSFSSLFWGKLLWTSYQVTPNLKLLNCTEKVQAANRKKLTTLKVHKGRPFHVSHITASIRVARCNSPNCNSKLAQLCFVRGLPVKIAYQGVKYTFFILAGFPWYNSHFGAKYQVIGVASTCGHEKQPC